MPTKTTTRTTRTTTQKKNPQLQRMRAEVRKLGTLLREAQQCAIELDTEKMRLTAELSIERQKVARYDEALKREREQHAANYAQVVALRDAEMKAAAFYKEQADTLRIAEREAKKRADELAAQLEAADQDNQRLEARAAGLDGETRHWEYMQARIDDTQDAAGYLGQHGWEMVAVNILPSGAFIAHFKRPARPKQ